MNTITHHCYIWVSIVACVWVSGCHLGGGSSNEGSTDSGSQMDTETNTPPESTGDSVLDEFQVQTKFGIVEGFEGDDGVQIWKGIPFAAPPLSGLRWRAPDNPQAWDGILETLNDPPVCTQIEESLTGTRSVVGSEDCLYLNIYRPAEVDQELPVYFWIHGGSNKSGGADKFDGTPIANRSNMVVVIMQYRLGPFGFLTHPSLRAGDREDPLDSSGNYGLLDQVKALEWVRDNIEGFGGDPNNVTVAGESAGATDIINLLTSPLAEGLFHRAISQSGGMYTVKQSGGDLDTNGWIDALLVADGTAANIADAAAVRTGMSDEEIATYLEAIDAEEMINNEPAMGVGANAFEDGVVLPGNPICRIRSGDYHKVPVLLGANDDEMKFFMPIYGPILSSFVPGVPDYSGLWYSIFGPTAIDSLLTAEEQATYQAASFVLSKMWRAEHADSIARELKKHQDEVYAYQFQWDGDEGSAYDFVLGAAHAVEIPLFFGSDSDLFNTAVNAGNRNGWTDLSSVMMDYVAQFAATGNPDKGTGDLPKWEAWSNDSAGAKVMQLDADNDAAIVGMGGSELTMESLETEHEEMTDTMAKDLVTLITGWHNYHSGDPVCE